MSAVRTLPIRLDPLVGEALDSWLEALAHLSHTALADLLGAVGLNTVDTRAGENGWVIRLSANEAAAVSSATGIVVTALEAMTLSHYAERALRIGADATVSRTFPWGRGRGSRYCPECLAEAGGRWQLCWRLGWSFACLRHHCLLADVCPTCKCPERLYPHIGAAIPDPGRCANPAAGATGRIPARCGTQLADAIVARFDVGHSVLAAQKTVYDLIEADAASFGVYQENPQPSSHALGDIRAVAARILRYASTDELDDVLPADLVEVYRASDVPLVTRSGRNGRKPGLCAPAHAVTAAVGVTAALTALNQPDVASAGRSIHWLVRGARERVRTVCPTTIGWSDRATSTLVGVQLASLGDSLKVSDQLRYRIAAPLPSRPLAGSSRVDHLVRSTPTMFWPAWSLRMAVPGCRHRYFRRILSAAILLVGTRLRLQQAADLVSPGMPGQDVSRVLQWIQSNATWEPVCAALTHCADLLADGNGSIDYRRRRQLDYSNLLPDEKWLDICRQVGTTFQTRRMALTARCFVFEQLSGLPARAAPFASDSWEFRNRVADFPKYLTPELDAVIRHDAEEFLATHHIVDEPAVWHPPTDVLDELNIRGQHPAMADIPELHRLIRSGRLSITAAAKRLHTNRDAIRYLLELHPAPVSPPVARRTRYPTPGPRKLRPAEAYQKARMQLTRDELIYRYEHQRLTLQEIGAQIGVSRGVVTRLAHDYGITARNPRETRCVIERDWLYDQYINKQRVISDIAQELGMSAHTVAQRAKAFGIPLRPPGASSRRVALDTRTVADQAPAILRPALIGVGGWERLRRFADAAQYSTLTIAAGQLGLPPARLVTQLNRVERELGGKLLVRAERGRPMKLTPLGAKIVGAVKECGLRDSPRARRQC